MEQYQIDNMLSNLQSYLETNGIRTDRFFQCINPEHPDRHPSMKYYDDNHVHCFGCGCTYDLIDVISVCEHLDKKAAFKKAIEYYANKNIEVARTNYQKTAKSKEKTAKNYEKAYIFWQKALKDNLQAKEYLLNRGIDLATAERFKLGFNCFTLRDKDKQEIKFNAIVIPVDETCFSARNINPNEEMRYFKPKACDVELFNKSALTNNKPICVLTEGEFDCLSFESIGVNCVGLGSANNINKFLEAEFDKNKTFILALDNDFAGCKATQTLKDFFKENNIKYKCFDNCGFKDPNEALVTNKNAFSRSIFSLIKNIEKQNETQM